MESMTHPYYLLVMRFWADRFTFFRDAVVSTKTKIPSCERPLDGACVSHCLPLPPGVWLPQHVHLGGQRLVRLQGNPLALQEVHLSARTWETAGSCAHLNTAGTKPRWLTLADTHTYTQEKRKEGKRSAFVWERCGCTWMQHLKVL